MVMRSPACFILRRVLMVTFFKVHLRLSGRLPAGGAPGEVARSGLRASAPRRSRAGTAAHDSAVDNLAPCAPALARRERLVEPRARAQGGDGAQELVEVGLALDEVDLAGVDHEQRRVVVAVEEVAVGGGQLGQIARVEAPLEVAPALLDAREQ